MTKHSEADPRERSEISSWTNKSGDVDLGKQWLLGDHTIEEASTYSTVDRHSSIQVFAGCREAPADLT
jgi:hypothetical protein